MAIRNTLSVLGIAAACAALSACGTSPDRAASAPVASSTQTAQTASGKLQVQWLGQSATKITTPSGKVIVIDPWLSTNPKTPEAFKRLEALGKVDLILVTHAHNDHYADAPALAKLNNAPVYGPAGLNQSLITLGVLPQALSQRFGKGGTIAPLGPGIRITATRAEHSSELVYRNPATDKDETHVGGEPVGYIIDVDGFRIYHMGDTGVFGDMKWIGDYYKPDLVLIPIGGHFVMDPKDAAFATRELLKPKYAIPVHYGTTPQLRGTPEEYISALGNTGTAVIRMQPGEFVTF
jgi:L-ascorbate metabolism protein UlaG (beta-lactamase superfamily)